MEQDYESVDGMNTLAILSYSLIGFWSIGTCCCGGIATNLGDGGPGIYIVGGL